MLLLEQLEVAMQAGEPQDGRKAFERVLREQRAEGQKLEPLLVAYLRFVKGTDQAEAGARFLSRYLDIVRRSCRDNPAFQDRLYGYEIEAWTQAGDDGRVARAERERERKRN